jgi:hypothetical protein
MLTLLCDCGETYYSEERYIGRGIACKKCGRLLRVARRPLPVPVKKAAVIGGAAIGGGALFHFLDGFYHVIHLLKSLSEHFGNH